MSYAAATRSAVCLVSLLALPAIAWASDPADQQDQEVEQELTRSERWELERVEQAREAREDAIAALDYFEANNLDDTIVRCLRSGRGDDANACHKVMMFYTIREAGTHQREEP